MRNKFKSEFTQNYFDCQILWENISTGRIWEIYFNYLKTKNILIIKKWAKNIWICRIWAKNILVEKFERKYFDHQSLNQNILIVRIWTKIFLIIRIWAENILVKIWARNIAIAEFQQKYFGMAEFVLKYFDSQTCCGKHSSR